MGVTSSVTVPLPVPEAPETTVIAFGSLLNKFQAQELPATTLSTSVRDARGRIARSAAARGEFQRENPCPATGLTRGACPGYIVDHVVALKHGGRDEPGNMQWQTVEQAKAKDRAE